MKIGYACIPLTIEKRTTRSFILKNFSEDRFKEALALNLKDLMDILEHNIKNNIYMFRISSDIVPFGSHEVNNVNWRNTFKYELQQIGTFIKDNNIRVSMHPGQYTVLNSPTEGTVNRSLMDLEYHTAFLDSLNVDYTNKIVLHVGGVYNDKVSAMKRFKENLKKLSSSAKRRLIIENDERCFNIEEVLNICHDINIPAVFDNLHHKYNPSLNFIKEDKETELKEILKKVKSTWKEEDGAMKLHYSDEDSEKKAAAHSKFVITENFLNYYNIVKKFNADIMLEVKDKDISAIKCINCISQNKKSTIYDEWAKYKYLVMEKNYLYYKHCSKIVNSTDYIIEFYKYIDSILLESFNEENFRNTLMHVWGYFKDKASTKEKEQFKSFLESPDSLIKAKNLLKKLSKKYKQDYLINSYYFL